MQRHLSPPFHPWHNPINKERGYDMDIKNNSQPTSLDEKDQNWIRIIEEWRRSGMSIAEWIRAYEDEEITYQKFICARERLFPDEVKRSNFMEKEVTWSTLSMEIPSSSLNVYVNDYRIEVQSGFDQELLQEIVEVLKNVH